MLASHYIDDSRDEIIDHSVDLPTKFRKGIVQCGMQFEKAPMQNQNCSWWLLHTSLPLPSSIYYSVLNYSN